MKRIIALYGHAECGKSRTMNILRELIRENGKSISSNPPYSGEQRETFLFNGQVVCLCPGGDDGAVVKGNFAYAASKNADIIITACRTRGVQEEKVSMRFISKRLSSKLKQNGSVKVMNTTCAMILLNYATKSLLG